MKQYFKISTKIILPFTVFFFIGTKSVFCEEYDFSKYNQSLELINNSNYHEAAQALFNLSIEELKQKKAEKKIDISLILFPLILSSICFEKDKDAISYDIWKLANTEYLKTNDSWESERKKFENKVLEISKSKNITDNDCTILKMENLLQLVNYFGPSTNDIKHKKFPEENLKYFNTLLSNQDKIIEIVKDSEIKKITSKPSKNINNSVVIKNNLPKIVNKKVYINYDNDQEIAKSAWKYFEANYNPKTGLFNAANYYSQTTMWDIGSSIAAIVSANKLNVIDNNTADKYIKKILNVISKLTLYKNELPNREYSTVTAKMTVSSMASSTGSGWSALDIGRTLLWLKILKNWYPQYNTQINAIVKKWDFKRLSKDQKMNGTVLDKGKEILRQEGRLGYEQYSATGFYLWGINLPKSLSYSFIKPVKIFNIEMYYDTRNLAYLTSEPFFLAKMEIGKIDNFFDEITAKIYQVQKIRWQKYNIMTSISEDSTDKMPWFVYNSVYFNGQTWLCTSPRGKPYPQYKSLSTKSVFAWDAIYSDPYSKLLKNKVTKLVNPEYGYYTGIYEKSSNTNKSVNINTNAVILESLLYKKLKGKPFLENLIF